ncbi:hypothetical protein Moror_13666 [Moniliophthora roreri MCA 2997]|uniref:N-acetyltransferase domain-containing protein n=2 Tax=Moniliophthora roreri TaxID=221103 RepID=V2WU75_MONRO|nr:hypothetical protein Moror_13666 [Moniliophthora roreri MCA 2997]KAI3600729.1 hypothetical protein WG66_014194 [Moniliophthora roreri]
MSKVTVHRIERLNETELEHAIAVHVKAYEGDLSMKVMLGGDERLVPELGRAMIRASLLEGHVYAVKNDSGDIVSFGLWFQPGTGVFGTEAQRALGFNDLFKKFSPEQQQWFATTYPEARKKYVEPLFTDEERSKRWWCASLVTDPEYQGKGYATAIVDTVYQRASEANEFLSLSTNPPVNVQKYILMGFRERGSYVLPSSVVENITVYVLSRD